MKVHSVILLIASSLLTPAVVRSADEELLRDLGGWYEGRFTGSFEGDSVSGDGRVRLPRANGRRIVIRIDDSGIRRDINGTINRKRVRGNRVTYYGRIRVEVEGVSLSDSFAGTARKNSRKNVLRIPVRISREILGSRYTVSGRFKGTQ